ncbi:MAG TPA: phosphatidylglycerophosphatase A [Verrucomicrobiae bacterium]|nr:phosphatidylglycerophosphatase A [Verrucomicrobiae bacterium]
MSRSCFEALATRESSLPLAAESGCDLRDLTLSSTLYDRDGHDPKVFSCAPISLLICYQSFPVVPLYWKTHLLLYTFRVFDIWKPFPARQLEHLPGGWGIMADDWMAGIYAAIVLRVALHFRVL